MTTRIIVDAHAGWPVHVDFVDRDENGNWNTTNTCIVPANTKENFYVHDGRRLVISERERS